MAKYFLGLDLAQAADYTALVIVEQHPATEPKARPVYDAVEIHRFARGTPYPTIVSDVVDLMGREPLKGETGLVVDATGVGRPVVDMFRLEDGLLPTAVLITGGDETSYDVESGMWRVPKRELVSTVQVLLHSKRLNISDAIPLTATLNEELLNFKVKISLATAHDSYGEWREGKHDDLVLALALAVWHAERYMSPGDMVSVVDLDDDPDDPDDDAGEPWSGLLS